MRDAYTGSGTFDASKVPPMPTSVNPPPVESRLERALRLAPRAPVEPHWKAIKHTGLRQPAPSHPPPPPQDFTWLHGDPEKETPWVWINSGLAIGVLLLLIAAFIQNCRPGGM